MTGRASRRKGHDFEREIAARLRAVFGEDVKRGWQARDGADAPDVDGTPFWIECKRGKRTSIYAALRQAEDAAWSACDKRAPVAICKDDGRVATLTMRLDDALDLIQEWVERGRGA